MSVAGSIGLSKFIYNVVKNSFVSVIFPGYNDSSYIFQSRVFQSCIFHPCIFDSNDNSSDPYLTHRLRLIEAAKNYCKLSRIYLQALSD